MLPVPVPAPALGSRAEEAVTALVRHQRKGGRPLCITHYLLGLILDDLDQLPGGNELFQGWDQHSAGGEGREQSIPVQAGEHGIHHSAVWHNELGSTGKAGF